MLSRPPPQLFDAHPAPLSIAISCPDEDTVVVTPAGEADYCTVSGLRQALSEATGEGRSRVIVDLDQLTIMDASCLGVLVEARLRMSAARGTLQVRCRSSQSRRLLSITGLDGMLDHGQVTSRFSSASPGSPGTATRPT